MGFELEKCCFCYDLRKGTVLLGVLWFIISAVATAWMAIIVAALHANNYYASDGVVKALFIFGLVLCALHVVFIALLILGAKLESPCLLLPWLIVASICLALQTYAIIVLIIGLFKDHQDIYVSGIHPIVGICMIACVNFVEFYIALCAMSLFKMDID